MSVDRILYDALDVPVNASSYEIRASYLKLIEQSRFDEDVRSKLELIKAAYRVLLNRDWRRIYDETGIPGLNKIFAMPENEEKQEIDEDLFHVNYNPENHVAGEITTIDFEVSLKDMFFGCIIPIVVPYEIPCQLCNGLGTQSMNSHPICTKCNGAGSIQVKLDPCFSTTATQICVECLGRGYIENESDVCHRCFGRKTEIQNRKIEIHIDPGLQVGEIISLPDCKNLKLIVVAKKHQYFERNGFDLIFKKQISLSQALFGVTFPVRTFDGKTYVISSPPDRVINPLDSYVIQNEGFPVYHTKNQRGDLVIVFDVIMPPKNIIHPELEYHLKLLGSCDC